MAASSNDFPLQLPSSASANNQIASRPSSTNGLQNNSGHGGTTPNDDFSIPLDPALGAVNGGPVSRLAQNLAEIISPSSAF
ncbi:hypothetical protein BT69DRAFT_1287185 [Atractiella rhizophila]|nr:hypothetical protein BT69DRAFT_1287185 [Atractiella rhizophila]